MKTLILALTALVGVAVGQAGPGRRDLQEILLTKVPHYSIGAANLLEAAGKIASDFDLPIGVEWQGDPSAPNKISREWSDATVEGIVYDTVSFDIAYQVEISNGVVHIRKAGLADSPRNPLNITLSSFSLTNEYSRRAAFKLRDQVNLVLFPRPQERATACAGSYGVSADETRVTLSLKDALVRKILDTLLVRSRSAMWLVIFRTNQSESGFLKTKSILRNATDLQEPDWDFLSRYDDPATGQFRGDWKLGLGR